MGSPAGAGGSGQGGTVYTPANQPLVDQAWQNTVLPLYNASANGGAGTPAGVNYPIAQNAVTSGLLNPATQAQATAGAGAAGNIGTGALPTVASLTQAGGSNPYYDEAALAAQQGAAIGGQGATNLAAGANQTLSTAYDPQGALFNRTQQQTLDQSNAVNAMSGVASTPYGASVTGNNLSNFDINWQNNQLSRQQTGLASAGSALPIASSLATTSGAAPSSTYNTNISNEQSQIASGLTNATSASTAAALPYNTGATIANNTTSGLTNLTNLGNNQYLLPEQVLNNLQSYLGLGQTASMNSISAGQTGLNELGGALNGVGSLLGGATGTGGGSGGGGAGIAGIGSGVAALAGS